MRKRLWPVAALLTGAGLALVGATTLAGESVWTPFSMAGRRQPPRAAPLPGGLLFRAQSEDDAAEEDEDDSIVTDRPDFTEASSVVGSGVVQIEGGYTFVYRDDEADGSLRRTHRPDVLFRLGVSENAELRLGWAYNWDDLHESGGRFSTPNGADDLYLGAKLALWKQCGWWPEQAIVVQATAPTGAPSRTTNHVEAGSNYLYSWDLGGDWSLGASSGVNTDRDDGDSFVTGHQSFTLGIPVSEAIGGFFEYHFLYFAGRDDRRPEQYLTHGYTYLLTDDVQFDLRAGLGLTEVSDDFFTGVGIAVRY